MTAQRHQIVDDLQRRKANEVASGDPAFDRLVTPSQSLTHNVLNVDSLAKSMTDKKVAVVKRKPILPPSDDDQNSSSLGMSIWQQAVERFFQCCGEDLVCQIMLFSEKRSA